MSDLPKVYLARHGETTWSLSGKHTGRTDIPLTPRGEEEARRLGERLRGVAPALVLASPLERARRTCELAGFGAHAVLDPDVLEWDYGEYEGRRTVEIQVERPGWNLFRDGCPGGEDAAAVGARADQVVARLRTVTGEALVFSHGHFLRVLAARWLGIAPNLARCFVLGTSAVSILGHEHGRREEPVIELWNERG